MSQSKGFVVILWDKKSLTSVIPIHSTTVLLMIPIAFKFTLCLYIIMLTRYFTIFMIVGLLS